MDIAREQKKVIQYKGDCDANHGWSSHNSLKLSEKVSGRIEDTWKK